MLGTFLPNMFLIKIESFVILSIALGPPIRYFMRWTIQVNVSRKSSKYWILHKRVNRTRAWPQCLSRVEVQYWQHRGNTYANKKYNNRVICRFHRLRAYLPTKPRPVLLPGRERDFVTNSRVQRFCGDFTQRQGLLLDAIFVQSLHPDLSIGVCPLLDPRPTSAGCIVHKLEASERGGVIRRVAHHPHTDRGVDGLGRPDRSELREVFRWTAECAWDGTPESRVPRLPLWRWIVGDDFRLGDEAASSRTATPVTVRFLVSPIARFKCVLAGGARH